MATVWYVRPKTGNVSEMLGRIAGEEDTCYEVFCADGRKRNMYRVQFSAIEHEWNVSKENGRPFSLVVWKQEGTALPKLFDVALFFKNRDKEVRDVREQLGAQLARKAAQK